MLGVKKRYRRLGIDLLLLAEAWKQAPKRGVQGGELGWVLEDNRLMVQALEEMGRPSLQALTLYQKGFYCLNSPPPCFLPVLQRTARQWNVLRLTHVDRNIAAKRPLSAPMHVVLADLLLSPRGNSPFSHRWQGH